MKKVVVLAICFGLISCSGKKAQRAEEAQIRFQVAQNLITKGETVQGRSELMAAKELDPDNSEVRNLLGLVFMEENRYDLAEKEFRAAVKLDPKYSEAHNHLCALLLQKERYDEAISSCTKAVENVAYPTPERAYHNMGVAYQKKGDSTKAIECFKKGLLRNPTFVLSRKSLGMIYMEQNKTQEAMKEFEDAATACNAAPAGAWGRECPEIYYQLALGYVKQKNRTKAQTAFKSCVAADKQGTYGKKCRENLEIMQ